MRIFNSSILQTFYLDPKESN